jgi:hypothetical protein
VLSVEGSMSEITVRPPWRSTRKISAKDVPTMRDSVTSAAACDSSRMAAYMCTEVYRGKSTSGCA